jgi:uroporphyrinogen-III synthase
VRYDAGNMSFKNARVLSLESRRAKEIAELIRLQGGEAFVAPALREVPLSANTEAYAFADRLYAGEVELVIFLTGVGARLLQRVLSEREPPEKLATALRHVAVVTRGPKPSAVMREWQVPIAALVPEPNTWREVLATVAGRAEKRVALQEYGRSNERLLDGLAAQGRDVMRVPVYNWAMPEDTAPLASALQQLLTGEFQVVVFTTGVQLEHFLQYAGEHGQREAAVKALRGIFVASIGPTCSEWLRECGVEAAMEPSHPKMGNLIREAAEQFERCVTL